MTLPEHCEPVSPFLATISSLLHICIPTPLALLSSTLGTLSIVSWLFAQLPQIYKNYSLQSTAGLSVFFLVEWCLGDSSNLIGAILTDQAGWQVTIATYYVLVDVVLVYQYYWYTYIKPWKLSRFGYIKSGDDDEDLGPWEGIVPSETSTCCQVPPTKRLDPEDKPVQIGHSSDLARSSPLPFKAEERGTSRTIERVGGGSPLSYTRIMLLVSMLCAVVSNAAAIPNTKPPLTPQPAPDEGMGQIAGTIISWLSTVLYLGSRLPQIFKNYRRKSTSGLSPLLFFAAFCGNLFYSTSLLTNPNGWSDFPPYGGGGWAGPGGNDRWEWVARATPFWLGAAGVLVLDGTVGVQFLIYAEGQEQLAVKVDAEEDRGRKKWKKVTGWMRGWIPSISPDRDLGAGETQSLLTHGQNRYGGA